MGTNRSDPGATEDGQGQVEAITAIMAELEL